MNMIHVTRCVNGEKAGCENCRVTEEQRVTSVRKPNLVSVITKGAVQYLRSHLLFEGTLRPRFRHRKTAAAQLGDHPPYGRVVVAARALAVNRTAELEQGTFGIQLALRNRRGIHQPLGEIRNCNAAVVAIVYGEHRRLDHCAHAPPDAFVWHVLILGDNVLVLRKDVVQDAEQEVIRRGQLMEVCQFFHIPRSVIQPPQRIRHCSAQQFVAMPGGHCDVFFTSQSPRQDTLAR
eukprot:6027302-Prymnesium_polylepis.1